jgi:RNA polymerase sigma-70 factor (ECF subfamily)
VEEVFRSCGGQVWRAVVAMTAGRVDIADDVTAEAFARLLVYQDGVRDPPAWVFRTAFRLAAAEMRRERQAVPGLTIEAQARDTVVLSEELTTALLSLSAQQRVAVFLHYFADHPVDEVGRLTGTSVTAVKVRLHRARRALRTSLEAEEVSHG